MTRDSGRHSQSGDPSGAPAEGCQSGPAKTGHRPTSVTNLTPSGVERIEAVTKAIMFADSGSTEDWQDNTNLGEAALAAIRADRTDAFEKVESYIYGLECRALADIRPPEVQEALTALALPSEPPSQGDVEGRAREIERLAHIVHNARFGPSVAPYPFDDEDAGGQEYCRRIARAVLTSKEDGRS